MVDRRARSWASEVVTERVRRPSPRSTFPVTASAVPPRPFATFMSETCTTPSGPRSAARSRARSPSGYSGRRSCSTARRDRRWVSVDLRVCEVPDDCDLGLVADPVQVDVVTPEIEVQRAELDPAVQGAARSVDAHLAVPRERRRHDRGVPLRPAEVSDAKIRLSFDRAGGRGARLELYRPVARNSSDDAEERSAGREPDVELRQIEALEPVHPCGERREGGEPREAPFDLVGDGPPRCLERQRARELRGRVARRRELEPERRALPIHGGRKRDVVVARAAAVERQPLHTQIHVGLVLERGPLRSNDERERLRGGAPERGAIDVHLGGLSKRGAPSAEAFDTAARPHGDRHSIPGGRVNQGGWQERADGLQASCRGA